jgi:hypothetical protein
MRNIRKTTRQPEEHVPYLSYIRYDGYSGANVYYYKGESEYMDGDGWYCFESEIPERIGKYEISNVTRQIHTSRGGTHIYTVYEARNINTNLQVFVKFPLELQYDWHDVTIITYSATTETSYVGQENGDYIAMSNVVCQHDFVQDIIPGVEYSSTAPKVFYNPPFPLLDLSSTPEGPFPEDARTYPSIKNVYTYEQFGIDEEMKQKYVDFMREGKTSLEDFNIFVDGETPAIIEDIVDCSCWGGLWFVFPNDLFVIFDYNYIYVTDSK